MTTSTTFALNCPICLDKLRNPVVAPCGHVSCDACIKTHARGSSDPYRATCPICRAPFSIVTPDLSFIPKKYHTFISSPLRRVFLDAREDNSRAVIKKLNAETAALKERVTSLEREKDLLTDQCDFAHCEIERLKVDEQTACLSYYKATADANEDKQNLNRLMAEYDALKFRARICYGLVFIFILGGIFLSFLFLRSYVSKVLGAGLQ